jgi:murein DD-endopeptidase MepM/ murein hydrolase activator NlpD
VSQGFGNEWPGVEPWGWKSADGAISPLWRRNWTAGEFHRGVDYSIEQGYRLRVPVAGHVALAGFDPAWGADVIRIAGRRYVHTLGHVSVWFVKGGEWVVRDELVGLSGGAPGTPGAGNSTGAHLHWEVYDIVRKVFVFPGLFLVPRVGEVI